MGPGYQIGPWKPRWPAALVQYMYGCGRDWRIRQYDVLSLQEMRGEPDPCKASPTDPLFLLDVKSCTTTG
jgi:hypothetical protein